MTKYIGVLAIVALIGVAFVAGTASAATYGKQYPRAVLFGVNDKNDTEVYKLQDGATTCYLMYYGKSGGAIDCVK